MDADDRILSRLDAKSDAHSQECHHEPVRFPVCSIDPQHGFATHDDFGSARNRWTVLVADKANHARLPANSLHFEGVFTCQKLDASVVYGEPNLDFNQLAGFAVGPEPEMMGLKSMLQFGGLAVAIFLVMKASIQSLYHLNAVRYEDNCFS